MILSSEVLTRPLVDGFPLFGWVQHHLDVVNLRGVTNHYIELEWTGLDSQKCRQWVNQPPEKFNKHSQKSNTTEHRIFRVCKSVLLYQWECDDLNVTCYVYPTAVLPKPLLAVCVSAMRGETRKEATSLVLRPHPLMRRNSLVNQIDFLGLVHFCDSIT